MHEMAQVQISLCICKGRNISVPVPNVACCILWWVNSTELIATGVLYIQKKLLKTEKKTRQTSSFFNDIH